MALCEHLRILFFFFFLLLYYFLGEDRNKTLIEWTVCFTSLSLWRKRVSSNSIFKTETFQCHLRFTTPANVHTSMFSLHGRVEGWCGSDGSDYSALQSFTRECEKCIAGEISTETSPSSPARRMRAYEHEQERT